MSVLLAVCGGDYLRVARGWLAQTRTFWPSIGHLEFHNWDGFFFCSIILALSLCKTMAAHNWDGGGNGHPSTRRKAAIHMEV